MSRLTLNGDMGDAGDPPRRGDEASLQEILDSLVGNVQLGPDQGFENNALENELEASIHAAAVAGTDLEDVINQVVNNIELFGDAVLENTPNPLDTLAGGGGNRGGRGGNSDDEEAQDNIRQTRQLINSATPIINSGIQAASAAASTVTSSQGSSSPIGAASSIAGAVTSGVRSGANAIGSAVGTAMAGPAGAFIGGAAGGAIASILMSPFTITIGILESIDSNISALSEELTGFSAEVTSASVDRELALLNDTIRRSDAIGSEVADLIRLQTEFQLSGRRAFDALFLGLEPYLKQILSTMQRAPEILLAGIAGILSTSTNPLLSSLGAQIAGQLAAINANTAKEDQGFDDDDMMALLDPQQFGRKLPQKPMPQVVP